MPLTIESQIHGDIDILIPIGSLSRDKKSSEPLRVEIQGLLRSERKKFILDFQSVASVDSWGYGQLARSVTDAKKVGGQLVLFGVPRTIQKFFDQQPRSKQVLTICETFAQAVERLN